MNFRDQLEQLYKVTGHTDTSATRPNHRLQQFRDALNNSLDKVCATCSPKLDRLVRVGSISVTPASTVAANPVPPPDIQGIAIDGYSGVYFVNDWCRKILSVYTQNEAAHEVQFRRPKAMDRDGSRNSLNSWAILGPYHLTPAPRTSVARTTGAAATLTGATISEASTTVDLGASVPALGNAYVGRMFRVNGEQEDYYITDAAGNGGRRLTLDKPYISRVRGDGVAAGSGQTDARWEISPAGQQRIQFLPLPNETVTVFYRYMAKPRRMIGLSDVPEIDEEYHALIWQGALKEVMAGKQNDKAYQMWMNQYEEGMANLKVDDDDSYSSDEPPAIDWGCDSVNVELPPGTDVRRRSLYW